MTSLQIAAIALVCALVMLLGGCSGRGGAADVTLADLATQQSFLDGQLVRTSGVVRRYDDPLHYWIEDDVPNRVEIVPSDLVRDLVGQRVEVEGRFSFSDDVGRQITVERVEVLDPNT